jgi:peptide/nickel transport system substrate-binding protein
MPIPSVAIMPADAVREASGKYIPGGKLDTKQLIGTGPYRIAEWVPDRHVRLVRFPEYARDRSRPPPASVATGRLSGRDPLHPGSRESARVAGLETGEYDFIDGVPFSPTPT